MPVYEDHQNLLVIKSADGNLHPVDDPEAWGLRRYHITRAIETSHGSIPNSSARVPLDIQSERSAVSHQSESEWTELSYQIAEDRRVNARMAIPHEVGQGEVQGIVCMFESGDSALATQIMEDLAARGMVAVSPEISQTQDTLDLPDLVWQAMRAADVLQACGTVHAERIGFIGNALDGQLGMYVAALDQRFVVTVSDASRASQLIALKPSLDYSLAELLAAIAPRSIQIALPAGKPMARLLDAQAQRARAAFELRRVPENLVLAPASQTSDRGKMLDWLEDRFRPRRFGPPARQRAPGNGN